MAKYELTKDWIAKNGEMIKKAFDIAGAHKYDINSQEDVLEISKIVDPENATEENAKVLSGVLKVFDYKMRGEKEKPKELN